MWLVHRGNILSVERFVMAVCALVGAAGLFGFGRHVWHAGAAKAEPSGIPVRCEIRTVYAPQALIDFAKAHPDVGTNDEFVRLIREANLNVWFATVSRYYHADGSFADLPVSYRPGEWPDNFNYERDFLLTIAGNPPESGSEDWTDARVEVIEEAMMEMAPLGGLRQLLAR
jgi:hypothetical protein